LIGRIKVRRKGIGKGKNRKKDASGRRMGCWVTGRLGYWEAGE